MANKRVPPAKNQQAATEELLDAVLSAVRVGAVTRQQLGKHASTTTEELCFLSAPCGLGQPVAVARVLSSKSGCEKKTLCVIFGVCNSVNLLYTRSSFIKIGCQETANGDCNKLRTLASVCQ
jgi:hypothetical protein